MRHQNVEVPRAEAIVREEIVRLFHVAEATIIRAQHVLGALVASGVGVVTGRLPVEPGLQNLGAESGFSAAPGKEGALSF